MGGIRSYSVGQAFEEKVADILNRLQARHRDRVKVTEQPRLRLQNDVEVVPDFDLEFSVSFERGYYLIECQDRKRSKVDIAQKIRYIKEKSNRNRFIFVHGRALPDATRNALTKDGVMVMTLQEFRVFVERLSETIEAVENRLRKVDMDPLPPPPSPVG